MNDRLAVQVASFPTGRSISIEYVGAAEESLRWRRLCGELVSWVFVERPVLTVTLSPVSHSWARFVADKHQLECTELACDRTRLLLLLVPSRCSRILLEDACSDEEFERGLLWLSSPSSDIVSQAEQMFRARAMAGVDEQGLCVADHEAISCEADGQMIVWCRPSRSDIEFAEFLGRIADSVDVSWSKGEATQSPCSGTRHKNRDDERR